MIKLVMLFRYIAILSAACLLSGCLGGTIAQQIVRSIATSVVDKTMARAMDVDEKETYNETQYVASANLSAENNTMQRSALQSSTPQSKALQSATAKNVKQEITEVDDYTYALANFSFHPSKPIAEPIPEEFELVEDRIAIVQGNQLVHVELFNLLIGEEKNAVYENARLLGSTSLPQKREWRNWNVGVGAIKTAGQTDKKMITFLIPPEFGKLPSGATAMVELASPGELNVARYKAN